MVGTFGRICERVLLVIASARTLPSFICGMDAAGELKPIGVCPPTTAAIAGPPPLKGACTRSRPSDRRKCPPARRGCVPAPAEGELDFAGLALIRATRPLTV